MVLDLCLGSHAAFGCDQFCLVSKDLMGLFEKRRFRNFVVFASEFDEKNPATFKGRLCACSRLM